MSHLLGRLLNSSGSLFERMIADLEKATANQYIDVDLVGKILTNINHKLRQLRLEPGNTLSEELYQALLARYAVDNKRVSYQLFINQDDELEQNLANLEGIGNKLVDFDLLGLSKRFIIGLLSDNPPKKLLKSLEFASSDQLFSQFDLGQVLQVAFVIEGPAWSKRAKEYLLNNLKRGYMELTPVKVEILDSRLAQVLTEKQLILSNQLLAQIVINPNQLDFDNGLAMLIRLLEASTELADRQNNFYLLNSVMNFNESFKSWYQPQSSFVWQLAGSPMPWRSINRAFAKKDGYLRQKFAQFSDHQLIDFDPYRRLLGQFSQLDFWSDTADLAYNYQVSVISLNLFDVSHNYQNLDQTMGQTDCFEDRLWQSLVDKYLENHLLADRVVNQLKIKLSKGEI